MTMVSANFAEGVGLGLRIPHLDVILQQKPAVAWFEVHICNFLSAPLNQYYLSQIAEHYPLSFHGVSLNLGGTDPLNKHYLTALKQAIHDYQPALVSEHACFTAHNGQHFHDLLPVPYTTEAIHHFASRIHQVQEALGSRILIENVSRYSVYPESSYSEAQFIAELCQRTGCGVLLDLNNLYVNQQNFPHDPQHSLQHVMSEIPAQAIGEIHLAGHSQQDDYLVDTHGNAVSDPVWQLWADFIDHWQKTGTSSLPPCLIEWDNNLPSFEVLLEQQQRAQYIAEQRCLYGESA